VIDSPEVQDGFKDLWARSNYGPNVPMSERREQGGWLLRNPDGTFRIEPFPSSWANGPCEINLPNPLTVPAGAVALVHTHPYRNGERLTSCDSQPTPWGSMPLTYRNDSSFDDDRVIRAIRQTRPEVIAIIIDAEKIVPFDGSDSDTDEDKLDRCGY
jgi:hypothetical protein